MAKSIYLANPKADFPTYFSAEVVHGWGLEPAICMAELTLPTVAAMIPDDFDVELCDENVSPVNLETHADIVAITGRVSQWQRMQTLAAEFRRRGKPVLIGGPFASLCPDMVRDHCDILVRGEIEEIADELFSDLKSSSWKQQYVGTRPSLDLTPIPRWDLYPNDRTLTASVQTSRGCPFECDFCDVIQYQGREQRHKPISNVLAELDVLYRLGYRSVFLADDNFTVARQRAKELLAALEHWNSRQVDGRVAFITQLSIDAARDDELLRMCAAAGLSHAFIGIETPNEASLRESKKPQNTGIDLVKQVDKFHRHGIMVIAGMITGFDSDGPDIFAGQYEFLMSAAIPIATLGALVAPPATPLHARLRSEGRLVANGSEIAAAPWTTNITPKLMTREELLHGIRWLANRIYEPPAFTERILRLIARNGENSSSQTAGGGRHTRRTQRPVEADALRVIRKIASLGPEESKMIYAIFGAVSKKPQVIEPVIATLLQYAQIRFMYEKGRLWEDNSPG